MALTLAAALALAAQCAPSVAPETLLSVVQVESRFDPLAIGVNGAPRISVDPTSVDDAVAKAAALIKAGRNIDLGLAQINSKNLSWLGLSLAEVFEPCTNLRAAARILQDGYGRSDAARVGEQAALKTALSYYNTGHPARGFTNGYVAKVASAAERIVPAIGGAGLGARAESRLPAPAEIAPTWDVFGEVHRGPNSFVTIVSNTTPGGLQ
jgi:type IV secretion system protein VirB1